MPALLVALALAAAPNDVCPAFKLSPLLGCYKVVDAAPPPAASVGGIRIGSLLQFEDGQASIYNDELVWARMTVEWSDQGTATRLPGKYRMGGEITLELDENGRLRVLDGKTQLATAERTANGAEIARLKAIPSIESIRGRTKECISAYEELIAGDKTFANVKPETFETTASAHGILALAQKNLAKACKPMPRACELPPMDPSQRKALEDQRQRCTDKK